MSDDYSGYDSRKKKKYKNKYKKGGKYRSIDLENTKKKKKLLEKVSKKGGGK